MGFMRSMSWEREEKWNSGGLVSGDASSKLETPIIEVKL
jgi:hypothetical protein